MREDTTCGSAKHSAPRHLIAARGRHRRARRECHHASWTRAVLVFDAAGSAPWFPSVVDPCVSPCATGLDACRLRRHDSALRVEAQTHVVSEIVRLRVAIGREAAAVSKTLSDHRSACDDDYPRWGWMEHTELRRQLGALHEHVAQAPSRSQDQLDLRAEFATLLCFAKTLRTDAEAWRAALDDGLKELERQEVAAREERARLAAEREALVRRRDALQFAIDKTARGIAQEKDGGCRKTLPVFRLGEALTVCSVAVLCPRQRFRASSYWLVTLTDARDQVGVRRC